VISDYLSQSSAITWMVLLTLSGYFIATVWIFVYRYMILKSRIQIENDSLRNLYTKRAKSVSKNSILSGYLRRLNSLSPELLKAAITDTIRSSTKGLTTLSIFASTAPFVGLFGTVVGILESFARLSNQKSVSLGVVAPAISEALVATAVGIFVAIFAYSAHLILKRMAYELNSILESEADILIMLNDNSKKA
jgi:biopolymer transport protein ExbB/TolQ